MPTNFANGDREQLTHVATIVVNGEGMVPLARQKANGRWALPKGKIEIVDHWSEQESAGEYSVSQHAALREVEEELGIDWQRIILVGSLGVATRYSEFRGTMHHTEYHLATTLARRDRGLHPSGEDIIQAQFFDLDEALQRLHNPRDYMALHIGYSAVLGHQSEFFVGDE